MAVSPPFSGMIVKNRIIPITPSLTPLNFIDYKVSLPENKATFVMCLLVGSGLVLLVLLGGKVSGFL